MIILVPIWLMFVHLGGFSELEAFWAVTTIWASVYLLYVVGVVGAIIHMYWIGEYVDLKKVKDEFKW